MILVFVQTMLLCFNPHNACLRQSTQCLNSPFPNPMPFQAYPKASLSNSDALAANELTTHAALQPPSVPDTSPYLVELLGGFQVTSGANAGEQWLVFKNDGVLTAADYASAAAGASQAGSAIGDGEFWDRFDTVRVFRRRHAYIVSALRQAMCGLAFMHARFRLHQSLGPYSLVLSTPDERDVRVLEARVRDLGFAVDVSDAALYGGATLADIWERGSIGRASEGPGYVVMHRLCDWLFYYSLAHTRGVSSGRQ